jgi:hypothetical protein
MNCSAPLKEQQLFQGVLVCADCKKMATHFLQKAKNEAHMLVVAYADMLRVALIKGQLRPPVLPKEPVMPKRDLADALKAMVERIEGPNGDRSRESKVAVSGVRVDDGSATETVHGR